MLNWINEFDPQNVNNKDLYLPPNLIELYNYSSTVIKKLPDFLSETIGHRLKQSQHKGHHSRINFEQEDGFNVDVKYRASQSPTES